MRPRNGGANGATPVRTTPIALLARRHAALWGWLFPQADVTCVSPRAQAVADHIRRHGASFFDELVEGTGLLRSQVEEALGELVGAGLVNADSFGGLRALLVPSRDRSSAGRRRRRAPPGMEAAGRWALASRPRAAAPEALASAKAREQEATEHVARALLQRYGVVFWRLLEREAAWLPPWRDLLRVYRRLESRGEVRGGRFVAGFSGEQYASPDAVAALRKIRRQPDSGTWVSLSAADPLNLVGILTPGAKLPALTGNRVLYRDGLPLALLSAGEVHFLEQLDVASEWAARKALLRAWPAPSIAADEDHGPGEAPVAAQLAAAPEP
jgi:ATP-dependent Lhr-like helicase